jgi:PAS domain S-box-containing protein
VLYGVLVLQRVEPFTSEELRLVRNLSNMSAAALENVELFHRVRTDQEQLRAILTESSDGIAIVGANACFSEVNPAFGRIFGVDSVRAIGMELLELLGYEDMGGENGGQGACGEILQVQQALEQQKVLPYVEVDLNIKGVSRAVGLSVTPVSVSSRPLCLVIARDVTAIRDATRMKANFLSMITHELRSPLNAISGYLDLALTGIAGDLTGQQREFLQRARAGSEHLYALIEDLLLVSRADAGQLKLNWEIIALQDVVANAVEELELTASDNGVRISVHVADDFPRVYADAVRIQQVLRNLMSNALRFTPRGGEVTIGARVTSKPVRREAKGSADAPVLLVDEEERVVEVQVSDTGCGIAAEHQEQIFKRFYQIPNSAMGRSSGQGLGLAIVKMIVELHGGRVSVESLPGEGSTFTFTLPGLLA